MATITERFKCEYCEAGFQEEILLAMHIGERHQGNGHHDIAKPIGQSTAVQIARLGVRSGQDLVSFLVAAIVDRAEGRLTHEHIRDICSVSNEITKVLEANYRMEKLKLRRQEQKRDEDD